MHVGFAGAGRMGVPMMTRLLAAGHAVSFFDPDPAAGAGLTELGATRVASPADLGAATASLSLVTDGAALLSALTGDMGIARTASPGHLHVSMSTVGPGYIRDAAQGAPNLAIVDAPVSGSVSFAREGELTTMVGASEADYLRAIPLLRALTRMQFHVGAIGAGSALKLAVNTAVAFTNHAIAEAIVFAEAHGITASAAYDVFLASVISSPYVHYKRTAFLDPGAPVEGSVRMLTKDLDLALACAADAGVHLPGAVFTRDALIATSVHVGPRVGGRGRVGGPDVVARPAAPG